MQKGFLKKSKPGAESGEGSKSQTSNEASKIVEGFMATGGKIVEERESAANSTAASTATSSTATADQVADSGTGGKTGNTTIPEKPKTGPPTMNIANQARLFKLGPVRKNPVACIVLGMAGSGKTTLMQRINVHIHKNQLPSYIINLDPAVRSVPYGCNIDIRDTVNYKEVMKQYQLGPNGGIMTALNLFSTKFDQVMELMEKRADDLKYIFVDTPGQV
jgi:hypothetical protein